MKVGDLVQCSHLNLGIIIERSTANHKHWWVYWVGGESWTIHERFLEVLCK